MKKLKRKLKLIVTAPYPYIVCGALGIFVGFVAPLQDREFQPWFILWCFLGGLGLAVLIILIAPDD